jgi:hypothetical protein
MPRLALAHSTGAEPRPARPEARPAPTEARPAQTMTARREPQAPRSSAHPMQLRPARPKRAQRSAAAPLPPETGPNLHRRALAVAGAWRALVDPMLEPADSRMSPPRRQAWAARRPQARPTTAGGRRGLPMKEPPVAAQVKAAAAAAMLRENPTRAQAPQAGLRAVGRPSWGPARPGWTEIPRSLAGPVSYPQEGRVQQASPRSEREQPKAMRARPTKAKWLPKASPARLRAGPSSALRAEERQSSRRPGLSAARARAEPTSMQLPRSGWSAMQGAPEVRLSCACAGGGSSSRGSRRTEPPPPKLCLRIQLASAR